MKRSKKSSERMDRLGYQDLLSKSVQNGLLEGGHSKPSSKIQRKAEPVVGTGRFLENSRRDTSVAAEGPESGHRVVSGMDGTFVENRGSPSVTTPKSVGTGIMRGRALRTEDLKIDGYPRSLLKSIGIGTKSRADAQSEMLSFRSLLEGAISASGVQPTSSMQGIADSGLQHDGLVTSRTAPESHREGKVQMPESRKGDGNFAFRAQDSSPLSGRTVGDHVSYSTLLQAQLGVDPVEVRTAPSCMIARTLHLKVEAHPPPVKLQLQSAEVEGGFLALLNQTTRLLGPVAQRQSSPRANFVSDSGRISGVRFSDQLLQAVAGDASRSADMVSERDGSDSLRATAVPTSAGLPRSEGDVSRAVAVVERKSSLVADSNEDTSGTPPPKDGGGPLAVNALQSADILPERVAVDFSEAAAVPASPVLTRIKEDVSPADVVVADSAPIVDEMSDAQLFEELSRGLAIEESRFAENASNMGAVDSPEAAATLTSPVASRTQQGVPREAVVMAHSVSTDEEVLDVQHSEELSGTLGVDESRSALNVPKRDVLDSSEASAVPEVPVFTEADLPARVERTSCVVADLISGEENASGVQPSEGAPQALSFHESRSGEIVSERGAIDSSEAAAEVVVAGSMGNDEEMSDAFVSDEPSQALASDELRNTDIVMEGDAATLSEGAAEPALVVPLRTREDVLLSEASVEKDVGLCGDAVVHSEQGNGHLLAFKLSDEQVLDERIESPSQLLETEKRCADSRDGPSDSGTKLVPSCQAGLKEMGDADADFVDEETILEWSCKARVKEMEDGDTDVVGLREENLCEVIAAGAVVECSRQAVPKQTDSQNALFVEEQNDEICGAHMTSSTENVSLKSKADIDSTKVVVEKESDTSKGGPVHSIRTELVKDDLIVNALVEKSSSLLPPPNGRMVRVEPHSTREHRWSVSPCAEGRSEPLDAGSVTDGGDHTVSRTEEKVEQERILGALEDSNEVIEQPEVEQHNFGTLAEELTEKQMTKLPYSESQVENQGFVASRTSYESEELPPLELVAVEPDIQNEEERIPEGRVGENVNVATDSGNSGVPADQALSTSPDAISEGLRQAILRDSDATISESLESVQVSGAEFGAAHQEAGKEVQSPLVMKSKDRHSRDVGDLENRHVSHPDNLEENEEQRYASPLNGTVDDQLVGAEVRSFKKKGRQRGYNHEKALPGAGRPHLQSSGSKRKRSLQYAGNRWRRNRHIDPDQPVPIYIEGRDEGFEEADDDAFSRWLAHQGKGNSAPSPAVRKRIRKHGADLVKPVIAIPSFRVVSDYEARMQEIETRRKVEMQQHLVPSTHEMLMSSRTVRASDYDMDDEDESWLHAWNKRLARGGLKQPISEDKFEEMIEYFERMYFQVEVAPAGDFPGFPDCQKSSAHSVPGSSLPSTSPGCLIANPATPDTATGKPNEGSLQKSFKSPAEQHPSDDCCICNGGEDDENNPVYTCKRCSIHVHQSCYGIRENFRDDEGRVIAPPSWCCRKCEAVAVGTAQPNVSCVLCRKKGGALKRTVVPRKWAHVACALYTNETFFVDPDAMEPIDGIAAVAARAHDRQDRCGLCGMKRGICSLCSVKGCRAPFHISCGVSQGASFELRQSKKKVVGVRSFCPRHARTTPVDSAPSAGLKEGHLVSSSTTSEATASATASGSISTASSMDYREEWSSRQNTSCMDGSFLEPARQATNVGTYVDLTNNVMSVTGKGTEDAGRGRPNGLRFTLKRRWDESCTQVSEGGFSSDLQKKSANGKVTGDKIEAAGCKSTWHVVEPGQKLKKIKFKLGKLAQNQDPESSPTLVQQERIGSEDPEAEKINEIIPAVGDASGDAIVNDKDTVFVNGLSEERFIKEVKELTILGEALKSGVAPVHIMREAFVYWRAKRAEHKGSLLCELNHRQWSKSRGIFNKDASDEGNLATGKLCVPLALQPSPVSTEKMLEKAKELREQLNRVRSMAQMVVQREKLKYNQQLVLMTIASAELNRAESAESEERHCVWCPSTKTLLKCGTCPRSFCFNCFKHRKGFGVKGWMAASKQTMYSCKYCRELSGNVADLSNNLDLETVEAGLVSTPVISSEPVDGMVSTPVITREPVRGDREKGCDGLQVLDNPGPASLTGGIIAPAKGLGIGRGKGNRWTVSDNAGPGSSKRGSENGAKPSELGAGLDKFLSIANDQMEHSSFETTLRRLKILRHINKDANQEQTVSPGNPAEETADVRGASGPVNDEVEPSTTNGGHVSPASGPALLVYKKNRRLILRASSKSPPSAYDFSDEMNYSPAPTGLGTRSSPSSGVIAKRLEIGGLERI